MLFTKASEYALLSLILISQKSSPVDVDTISNELKKFGKRWSFKVI